MCNLRDGSAVNHYRWDAETHEIELAFENPAGERLVRSLEADEDGVLYGVTYPNAKLFSYDPETGDLRDYGSLATDDSYAEDRKSTRLNSSHVAISYAVFCLKKKKN